MTMKTTGRDLRERVDNISDVLSDIKAFMDENDEHYGEVLDLCENIQNDIETLFYYIPNNVERDI